MDLIKIFKGKGKFNQIINNSDDDDNDNVNPYNQIKNGKVKRNALSDSQANNKDICSFEKIVIPRYKIELSQVNWEYIIINEDNIIQNKTKIDFYICNICTNLINDPRKCSLCDKFFCRKCIENSRLVSNRCSSCRQESEIIHISKTEKNILDIMIIKCPFNCGKEFSYEQMDQHLNQCTHATYIFTCELCQDSFKIMNNCLETIKNHDNYCKEISYECSNCFDILKENQLEEHKLHCNYKYKRCDCCFIYYPQRYSKAHSDFYCEEMKKFYEMIIKISRKIDALNY